ncbi:protein translocase subunit SecE [Mycolicibacterium cyprinidarum]|nr:protein translocase subunit SecE [Mycolicibacterium sp. NGTWS1803]
MSDEREGADAADTGADSTDTGGQTAVGTQPLRPTGKRTRRGAAAEATDEAPDTESSVREDDGEKKRGRSKKTASKPAKKPKDGPSRNPFVFVWNYLQEVIAELRKVIWPNRKEMVGYTIVVLIFLVFMVTLIGVTDLGLGRLVMTVFG